MAEPLERETVVALLEKLGGADDAEVLAAARELHSHIEAADLSWDELIVPEDAEDIEDDDEDALDEAEEFLPEAGDTEEEHSPEQRQVADAESLALIDKLLAGAAQSKELREELKGYKEDIAEGEFTAADRRYLRALAARLKK